MTTLKKTFLDFLRKKIFLKYILNGVLINLLSIFFFYFFTIYPFIFNPILVISVLIPILTVLNYIIQLRYVFIKKSKFLIILKYYLLMVFNYFANLSLLYVAIYVFYLNHLISQIIIILILAITSFIINKKYVYI
jgi:putative flippase GtrA